MARALLWKKEPFFSSERSILPYNLMNWAVEVTSFTVLNGPILLKPTTSLKLEIVITSFEISDLSLSKR